VGGVHRGAGDVHRGAGDVHRGVGGVHRGAGGVHRGVGGFHRGAGGIHANAGNVHARTGEPLDLIPRSGAEERVCLPGTAGNAGLSAGLRGGVQSLPTPPHPQLLKQKGVGVCGLLHRAADAVGAAVAGSALDA
jgi:hypothetical protein